MKTVYNPITDEMLHAAATLLAAGVRPHAINAKVGTTRHSWSLIEKKPEWPAILESKRVAIATLMRGDA